MAEKEKPAEPRSPFATVLKWAGGITVILSLVFALQRLTQSISENRERKRNTAELYRVGKLQQSSLDYAAAWKSFESGLQAAETGGQLAKLTGQLGKEQRQFREAQEDLAMEWLENISVNATRGETFTDVVTPLGPVLTRGSTTASGARKADLLAHVGWSNFLQWRDGKRLTPEPQYKQALEADSLNPYGHAYLAHWLLWTNREEALPEAREHFAAALRAGRARADVRSKQVAAMMNLSQEGEPDLLRVVAEMRQSNDSIDVGVRSGLYHMYSFACRPHLTGYTRDPKRFEAMRAAIPIEEHTAILQTLFGKFEQWPSRERVACRAALLEAANRREEAARIWTELRQTHLGDALWRGYADAALKRLSQRQQ